MIKYVPKPTVTPIMTTTPFVSTTSITDTTTALTTISTTTPTRVSSKKRRENHKTLFKTHDILSKLLKLPITREALSPK